MTPKYNPGDKVYCKESHEINQPMEIVGLNRWFDSSMNPIVYYVKGTHKRGSEIIVTLTENILSSEQ